MYFQAFIVPIFSTKLRHRLHPQRNIQMAKTLVVGANGTVGPASEAQALANIAASLRAAAQSALSVANAGARAMVDGSGNSVR